MKHYYFTLLLVSWLSTSALLAQDQERSWSLEAGVNYVNLYSAGEDSPQGPFFDEFFNINDHWNLGTYIALTKSLNKSFSFTTKVSFNEITKWGETGNDVSVITDNLEYYGVDGMFNLALLKNARLSPFIAVGGGYTWIEEGPYNTFSLKQGDKNLVGAGTLNGALGFNYKISDRLSAILQFTYKHTFKEYLTKHFQNSIGISYKLDKSIKKESPTSNIDSDQDGVEDRVDLCPDVPGLKIFAGCPDTDGDGIPDSLDKCPNEKDGDSGCVKKEPIKDNNDDAKEDKQSKQNINLKVKQTVYFEHRIAKLDHSAEAVLDQLIELTKNVKDVKLLVEGHTDNTGSKEFNKQLSMNRANNVKAYLVDQGISGNNIDIAHFGETQPAESNDNKQGRFLNRRAEITITIKND